MAVSEVIQKDIKKYLSDPTWRLNNLYYIKDKYGHVVKFVMNPSQRWLWRNIHYLNIILKDRQRGFSTLIALIILDTCLFSSNQACGIIDLTLADGKKKLAKIKFAYERLPEQIKEQISLTTDAKEAIEFSNGSSVYVGTSHRGGTLQILHLSEMGAVSTRSPDRAKEIRSGALNTIAPGCYIFNESTADGAGGDFYKDCQTAMALDRDEDAILTPLDYKFHFFGWWMGSENELPAHSVCVSTEDNKYFNGLEKELGIKINANKRAWYVKKRDQIGDEMFKEYPSTPDEAFKVSADGSYFAEIFEKLEAGGQIGNVPVNPAIPVNSAWDFGLSDTMVIWLHQYIDMQHRIVGYLCGHGKDVVWFWRRLQEKGFIWGTHFLPHDGNNRRIGTADLESGIPKTIQDILNDAGMYNTQIVPRILDKYSAIQETRNFIPMCWFDKKKCTDGNEPWQDGINCLKNYKREWDDKMGTWKSTPRHDWASHGYDAFETLARGIGQFGVNVATNNSNAFMHKPAPAPVNWRVA